MSLTQLKTGLFFLLFSTFLKVGIAQSLEEINGQVTTQQNEPLPYTTIFIISNQKGAISNEDGYFNLNTEGLLPSDSVRFQYVGFQEQSFSIGQLKNNPTVKLTEKINQLGEVLVFGLPPNPETIIKQVIKNLDKNYSKQPFQKNLFIRERNSQTIKNLEIDYKKSSINQVDENLFKEIEKKTPKYMTWYTDFLGDAYQLKTEDETKFKLTAERVVGLKQDELTETENIEKIFEDLARNTKEGEYWKIKTGIVSTKIDLDIEDSTNNKVAGNMQKMEYFVKNINGQLGFATLKNEDQWEFLHNPRKYNFTLVGGSRFNGENVYIIDFEPKSGDFTGRVYISTDSYALVRADYHYAPGKTGTDVHLLGIGYTKSGFDASINFEKVENKYYLKYFSKKETTAYSVERKISLIKKRERFLFDKELEEVKLALNLAMSDESSIEIFIFNHQNITQEKFSSIKQEEYMKVIYVDQFDDQLWKGYSIIQPTEQMKSYKKVTE